MVKNKSLIFYFKLKKELLSRTPYGIGGLELLKLVIECVGLGIGAAGGAGVRICVRYLIHLDELLSEIASSSLDRIMHTHPDLRHILIDALINFILTISDDQYQLIILCISKVIFF